MTYDSHYSKRLVWSLWGAILLSPLLFLFTNPEWMYSPIDFFDSHFDQTYAYFYDTTFHKNFYKAGRVPWIAPLFYLQKLVGPHLLSPTLALGSWVLIASLYFFLLKNIFGMTRSFLIFPWIVFYPHLIGMASGGFLYNNTAAVIYMLAALCLWSSNFTTKRTWAIEVICGFLILSCLATNIVYVHLLLLFPIIDFIKKQNFRFTSYLYLLVGALGGLFFWCTINYLHNRPFWFFMPMFNMAENLILHPENQAVWWLNLTQILAAPKAASIHLVFFVAVYLASFVKLILDWFRKKPVDILACLFVFLFTLWTIWHFTGQTALTPPDFSYPLQIPMFLLLTQWLKDHPLHKMDYVFVLASGFLLWLCLYSAFFLQSNISFGGPYKLIFAMGLLFIALTFLFLFKGRLSNKIGYIIIIGFIYSMTSIEKRGHYEASCTIRADSTKSLINIMENLHNIDPSPERFFVFADYGQPVAPNKLCPQQTRLHQDEFPRLVGLMMGHHKSTSYLFQDTDDITKYDLELIFNQKKNIHLVLFPFNSPTFSQDFLEHAELYGLEFEKKAEYKEHVLNLYTIPYEIYTLKPSSHL